MLARVAQLGPQATAVVEAAAIAPPSLDAALLLAVCGEAADSVDECLSSGVLHAGESGVAFRHELSRVAVEESLSPARRLALHRSVLLALTDTPRTEADLARIVHHAEEAADRDAVLRYAPTAAEQAARAGAYREAAAQYARALRFAADLPLAERAALLEGRARACYLADDQLEAIAMIRDAIECRRSQAAALEEARALTELTDYLWCRGYLGEADESLSRASQLAAGRPSSASTPTYSTPRRSESSTSATSTRESTLPAVRSRSASASATAALRGMPGSPSPAPGPAATSTKVSACSRRRWSTPGGTASTRSPHAA